MTAPPPRLQVLMTADTVGGVWTYARELIAALAPLDVDVTLATMGAPLSPAQAREAAALTNLDVRESRFALEWMPDPWREVDAASEWLLELAHQQRPALVHVNGYAHASLPFGVPVIAVAHSCVCSWFRAVRGSEAGPVWAEYRRRAARGLRAATAVVAPTAAILDAILDALSVTRAGRVIPNGRGRGAATPTPKEPFVLGAGRLWDEAKGLTTLDACAARVSWPIRVAGPHTAPMGGLARPASAVELLGELAPAQLASWMGRASLYAHPARYEPFGLAVLEAALAGCALVLSELPTLREIWGDAARYVPPGDPDALAFELERLISAPTAPADRAALAERAGVRARALTPARMATAYRALYEEVCA